MDVEYDALVAGALISLLTVEAELTREVVLYVVLSPATMDAEKPLALFVATLSPTLVFRSVPLAEGVPVA